MTITLYFSPGACSLAPHVVLNEIGEPFALRRFVTAERANHTPEYLAVNPKARIPALVIDGFVLTENPAILAYLGKRFPDAKLYPNGGESEARCLEWLAWLSNSVHVAFAQVLRPERYVSDAKNYPPVVENGYKNVCQALAMIEMHLAKNPYMLGDSFSVVDANLLPFYRWANGPRIKIDMSSDYPAYTRFILKLGERPSVKKALEVEGLSLMA